MNKESLTPERLIRIIKSRLFIRGLVYRDSAESIDLGHIQILIISGAESHSGTFYYAGWLYDYYPIFAHHKHLGIPIRFTSMTAEKWLEEDAFLQFLKEDGFWKRSSFNLGVFNFPNAWISRSDEKLAVQRQILRKDEFKDELVSLTRLDLLLHLFSLQGIFSQKYFTFQGNGLDHLLEWKVFKRINGFLNENLKKWNQVVE